MDTLLPDFSQATFESSTRIDNSYFPLTPGTVFSYQGEKYETEEIIEEVAEEIGEEIAEDIVEELGNKSEFDDDNEIDEEDNELDELADDIEEKLDKTIDRIVDEVIKELGDEEIEEFDPEELAEAIAKELIEDITEELTGKEIESDNDDEVDDFVDEIVEALDDGIDELAVEIAEEIAEAQADLFATETNQVFVTFDTRDILGVQAVVVRDVAWEEGVLVEDTFDWYAQDTNGNVWYLGELATNYEYDDAGNFIGTNNDGSWEAGVDGALPGLIMEANPQVGDNYYQEFAPGIAEDRAVVVSINESISIDFGNFENVLQTRDFTELEPDKFEFKYYAPGVGQILADEGITEEGGEPELSPELIGISNLANVTLPALSTTTFENSAEIDNLYFPLIPGTVSVYKGEEIDPETGERDVERHRVLVTKETKDILGITSRVVRDREFEDGLLTEETFSYYAQDTEGNVWLLGESITEYEYNPRGRLIDTDDSDSWIAGQDQFLPGLIMEANPQVGDAYYQRFSIQEAEDRAEIVNSDASINFGNFDNAIQVREFSALDDDGFDYKYYAPGVGQVFEQEINEDNEVVFSSSLIKSQNVFSSSCLDCETASLI
jgi:hypothetical protein